MLSLLLPVLLPFLSVAEAVDPAAGLVPWPISLAMSGATLSALIAFFVWQNRQITLGRWYPAPIVEKMLSEKDVTIADLGRQLGDQRILIEEQRKTIRAGESTADTNAKALVQATSNQSWIDVLVQRSLGGGSGITPQKGHNGQEEVPS